MNQQYYVGTVVAVEDKKIKNSREFHEIIADIPGIIKGIKAFPDRSNIDEPQVGDQVLLLCLDPEFKSYFLYKKLKENDFIGFRASGKMVDITPDYITVGVYDKDRSKNYTDDEHWDGKDIRSNHIAHFTIDKKGNITIEGAGDNGKSTQGEGNLTVYLKGNTNITIDGAKGNTIKIKNDSNIEVGGKSEIHIKGDSSVSVDGNIDVSSKKDVTIVGQSMKPNIPGAHATEPAVFGNQLKQELEKLSSRVDEIVSGIDDMIGPKVIPVPQDGGVMMKTQMSLMWMPHKIKLALPALAPLGGPGKEKWDYILNDSVTIGGDVK